MLCRVLSQLKVLRRSGLLWLDLSLGWVMLSFVSLGCLDEAMRRGSLPVKRMKSFLLVLVSG